MMSGVCADCGVERQWLHEHHLLPRVLGGSDETGNLVGICANCHEDRHAGPFGGTLQGRLANTPEARAKKAQSMRERWQDEDYRTTILATRAEVYGLRDQKAIGEKVRATWTPERRQAHSERIKEIRATKHWVSNKGTP